MHALFDVSHTVNFEGNISKSSLRFQKTTVGLVLPSTARDEGHHSKNLSVFERLERGEAEFFRKSTATYNTTGPIWIFCFVQTIEVIKDIGSGGGIEPPTLGYESSSRQKLKFLPFPELQPPRILRTYIASHWLQLLPPHVLFILSRNWPQLSAGVYSRFGGCR